MRTKQDPGIRQEAFIDAATALYMEKGFEAVSIRDILDAVADKTTSPSVFYYYFKSKDELYRACVESVAKSYLAAMEEAFSADGNSLEDGMFRVVSFLEEYLIRERNLIKTGGSAPNRMFVLDMRERVTEHAAMVWADSIKAYFCFFENEAENLAHFLAGGIGQVLFHHLQKGESDEASMFRLTESIAHFVMNVIGLPESEKKQRIAALKEKHNHGRNQK